MVDNWHLDLDERRKFLGLTQGTLAQMTGVSREHLGLVERGQETASPKLRWDIEQELKVQAVLRHCKQTNCEDCMEKEPPHRQMKGIKEKRLQYGVSRFEVMRGTLIAGDDLQVLESGKQIENSAYWREKIDDFLSTHRPRCPKEILIDYVTIRFPYTVKCTDGEGDEHGSIKDIWENVLGIQMNDALMYREDKNFHNYTVLYQLFEITLRFSPKHDSGVLLEMRGKGCRNFESILRAQGRDWYDFFDKCLEKRGSITRLDIAVDDTIGLLSIPELIEKRKQGFADFGRMQSVDCHESTLPDRLLEDSEDGTPDMGATLSIGSPRSPIRFCFYEKNYEQAKKQGRPLGEILGVKNRVEIRLRDDRAQNALQYLVSQRDIGGLAFGIINDKIRFLACPRWERFANEDWEKIQLTTKPEKYTDERSWRWFVNQCVPTLKYHMIQDTMRDTDRVNEAVRRAKLSSRHKAMLKQSGVDESQVILPELLVHAGMVEPYEIRGRGNDSVHQSSQKPITYTPITWDEIAEVV